MGGSRLTFPKLFSDSNEELLKHTFVFWISGSCGHPGDNNNNNTVREVNSRMTSYLKVFATGRTNLKIFPAGTATPEIQNTFVQISSKTNFVPRSVGSEEINESTIGKLAGLSTTFIFVIIKYCIMKVPSYDIVLLV